MSCRDAQIKPQVEVLPCAMPTGHCPLERSKDSRLCPSGKNMKIKICMQRRCNDNDKAKQNYREGRKN
jgi:hypothetical protein